MSAFITSTLNVAGGGGPATGASGGPPAKAGDTASCDTASCDTVSCDTVVVAAGCWSAGIAGLPEPLTSAPPGQGPDRTVTAGAVHDLLHDAMRVLPVLSELALAEPCAGLRPAAPDNGPVAGPTGLAGLLAAMGHYRNGILLSAVTADAVVAWLTGEPPAEEWAPFSPQRFTASPERFTAEVRA